MHTFLIAIRRSLIGIIPSAVEAVAHSSASRDSMSSTVIILRLKLCCILSVHPGFVCEHAFNVARYPGDPEGPSQSTAFEACTLA